MELWIRSQDKDILVKVDSLLIDDNNNDIYTQCWVGVNLETYTLGKYKTKERALEILDDIQDKIKNILILSINPLMPSKDQHKLLDSYKQEFNRDFILETSTVEIKPLNSEIVLYEMPKE